jgi:hypothetical protein
MGWFSSNREFFNIIFRIVFRRYFNSAVIPSVSRGISKFQNCEIPRLTLGMTMRKNIYCNQLHLVLPLENEKNRNCLFVIFAVVAAVAPGPLFGVFANQFFPDFI